ncbi:MAG TPA: alpha/beta fold hydrolase [Thermoleophilaceae bacterium]|nr:alpha/beta fold hydrolase [Thermoleophilaceae bacterium]
MELTPKLIETARPADPAGAVIVLHGGASRRENMMVSPTQLSVLRMIPIARATARAGRGELAVFRLLNSRRGWDTHHTPVRDAEWALAQVASRLGPSLPVCLVGHSLGGRAALMAAGAPQVRGAVALAPWVLPGDDPPGPDDRPVLIVHGDRDRIASPQRSAALAERLRRRGRPVEYVTVPGGKHAMLSHHREFTGRAAEFATQVLRVPVTA